jgi:hypothetical protein
MSASRLPHARLFDIDARMGMAAAAQVKLTLPGSQPLPAAAFSSSNSASS